LKFENLLNFEFESWKITKFWIWHLKNCWVFKISNVKFEKWPNFKFGKLPNFQNFRFWIWKITEFQIWKITAFSKFQISNWTTKKLAKAPPRVLSELNYDKAAFLKEPRKKQSRLVWLFQKQRHFKSQTKHPLSPFQVVYGFNPCAPIDLLPLPPSKKPCFNATQWSEFILKMHETTKLNIEKMNEKHQIAGSKGQNEVKFESEI
jgi:hypothetical protein